MDAVILFSHGSLLCGSGEALNMHAERLRAQGIAPFVEVGYLNYTEPFFAETVSRAVAAGATRILVTPYFLVPGYFVKVDLPKAVAAVKAEYPGTEFIVAEAINFDERLADALISAAQTSRTEAHWRDDIQNASRYCRPDPRCPLFGTSDCPKRPSPLPAERSNP